MKLFQLRSQPCRIEYDKIKRYQQEKRSFLLKYLFKEEELAKTRNLKFWNFKAFVERPIPVRDFSIQENFPILRARKRVFKRLSGRVYTGGESACLFYDLSEVKFAFSQTSPVQSHSPLSSLSSQIKKCMLGREIFNGQKPAQGLPNRIQ